MEQELAILNNCYLLIIYYQQRAIFNIKWTPGKLFLSLLLKIFV